MYRQCQLMTLTFDLVGHRKFRSYAIMRLSTLSEYQVQIS